MVGVPASRCQLVARTACWSMPGAQRAVPVGASDQASLVKKLMALVVALEDAADTPADDKVSTTGLSIILRTTELDVLVALDQLPPAEYLALCAFTWGLQGVSTLFAEVQPGD